jgi:hypothetical protein
LNTQVPAAPFAYIILQYRRKMHMSYQDVCAMPSHQLLLDLEMMSLEAQYGPANAKTPTPKSPNMP